MNFESSKENNLVINKEFVEAVERSKLETGDKTNLLLTRAGLKPASEIFIEIGLEGGEVSEKYLTEDEINQTINLLKKSGLEVEIGERKLFEEYTMLSESEEPESTHQVECIRAFVAGSKDKLEALTKVWGTPDQEAIGLVLGIPRSAVEAHVGKKEPLDPDDLPADIKNSDARIFLAATLSKDNWQEELKVGQARADFMKKTSPAIYKEMVEAEVVESEKIITPASLAP